MNNETEQVALWVEIDLHRIIRENDRVLVRVTVPKTMKTGHLKAAGIRMANDMKPQLFRHHDHWVLADMPETIVKVTNAYPDVDGGPMLDKPLLDLNTHEVVARIFDPSDRGAGETR